jgi:hypothetical protein
MNNGMNNRNIAPHLYTLIDHFIPDHLRSDHPRLVTFISKYLEFLEKSHGASYFANTLEHQRNIDLQEEQFLTRIEKELGLFVPRDYAASPRVFYNKISELWRSKGTEDATKTFFQLFLNDPVEIRYPWDNVLKTSDGKWIQERKIRVSVIFGDVNNIIGKQIEQVEYYGFAFVHKTQEQIYSDGVIHDLFLNRENILGDFFHGNTIIVRDTADFNRIIFKAEIYKSVTHVKIINGGKGYKPGDKIGLLGRSGFSFSAFVKSTDNNGTIKTVLISNNGSGNTPRHLKSSISDDDYFMEDFKIYQKKEKPRTSKISENIDLQLRLQAVIPPYANEKVSAIDSLKARSQYEIGENIETHETISIIKQEYNDVSPSLYNTDGYSDNEYFKTTESVYFADIYTGSGITQEFNDIFLEISSQNERYLFYKKEGTDSEKTYIRDGIIYSEVNDSLLATEDLYKNTSEIYINDECQYYITDPGANFLIGKYDSRPITSGFSSNTVNIVNEKEITTCAVLPNDITNYFADDESQSLAIEIKSNRGYGAELDIEFGSVITTPGYYEDDKGQLSSSHVLQDSERHQRFSYEIVTSYPMSYWKNVLKQTVHPAGLKAFSTWHHLRYIKNEPYIDLHMNRWEPESYSLGENEDVHEVSYGKINCMYFYVFHGIIPETRIISDSSIINERIKAYSQINIGDNNSIMENMKLYSQINIGDENDISEMIKSYSQISLDDGQNITQNVRLYSAIINDENENIMDSAIIVLDRSDFADENLTLLNSVYGIRQDYNDITINSLYFGDDYTEEDYFDVTDNREYFADIYTGVESFVLNDNSESYNTVVEHYFDEDFSETTELPINTSVYVKGYKYEHTQTNVTMVIAIPHIHKYITQNHVQHSIDFQQKQYVLSMNDLNQKTTPSSIISNSQYVNFLEEDEQYTLPQLKSNSQYVYVKDENGQNSENVGSQISIEQRYTEKTESANKIPSQGIRPENYYPLL